MLHVCTNISVSVAKILMIELPVKIMFILVIPIY